jgi:hypothetical protein
MSGFLKSIGKVFKKVVKVIKKVALPALAIGAVILSGGAALGALPSVASVLGSGGLGLGAGLTSVMTTAVNSAGIGAAMGVLTGKNPIKAATTGLITGGLLGGANLAMSGAAAGAGGPMSAAGDAAAGADLVSPANIAAQSGAEAVGINGLPMQVLGESPVANGVTNAATRAATGGGGLMGFVERNQVLAGSALQGLGGGLIASENAKAERKREQRVRDSYGVDPQGGGLWTSDDASQFSDASAAPRPTGRLYWDSKEMRLRNTAEA